MNGLGRWECHPHADPLVVELFNLMAERGMTIADLAQRSGVSAQTLGHWKYARSAPSVAPFRAAAKALGFRLEIRS